MTAPAEHRYLEKRNGVAMIAPPVRDVVARRVPQHAAQPMCISHRIQAGIV